MAVFVVVIFVARPAAQFLAEKQVRDAAVGKRPFQLVSVELRRVLRVRIGPNVDDELDFFAAQSPHDGSQIVI